MRIGPILTLAVAVVAGLSVVDVAAADEPAEEKSEYDRLVDEAVAEFDRGDFEEALSAFEQAYKVRPSARALRGVAKALFELRSYARCVTAIDRALASDVDPLTDALRADLESLKARAQRFVGAAVVEVAPPTATVLLDGEPIDARVEGPRPLDVGAHTLEVTAPDHEPQRRKLEIHGGETTRVVVRLDPVRAAARAAPAPAPAEPRVAPLVLAIGAVVASTGAVVGSSIWFVDRGGAVDRCDEAAAAGARCANAGSLAFQRDASTWTLGLSGAALVASVVALVLVVRGDKRPPTKPVAWAW